jgi:predicted RNA binding protein YcfA (HicA-like mRNA interferase family)
MPRGLFNWTFKDIEKFLKANGFVYKYTNGSHYYFQGIYKGSIRVVCVPFHGKNTIKPRTVKGIILQSGVDKDTWFKF